MYSHRQRRWLVLRNLKLNRPGINKRKENLMQNLKTKTVVLIFLGVMMVGGLGYGGYRLLTKEKPENDGNTNQSTQSATTQYTWQTYRNDEFGFSFEYPDFWTQERVSKDMLENSTESRLCFKKEDYNDPLRRCAYVDFGISKTSITGKSILEWYNDLETDEYIRPIA